MKKLEAVYCDAVVIGGGVVGLSVAWHLSKNYKNVVLVEKDKYLGSGNTTRNSGVVHAGIYYEKAPLKQKFCLEGNLALNSLIRNRSISGRICGKFVIAQSHQRTALEKIYNHATEIGVDVVCSRIK